MPSSSAVFCAIACPDHVIKLVTSLQLESDNINSWKTGVARALKKYLPESLQNEDVTEE